jgi:hypothetical protein
VFESHFPTTVDEVEEFADEDETSETDGDDERRVCGGLDPADEETVIPVDEGVQVDTLERDVESECDEAEETQSRSQDILPCGLRRKNHSDLQDEGQQNDSVPQYREGNEGPQRIVSRLTHKDRGVKKAEGETDYGTTVGDRIC